jgi:hypothetical protein
MCGLYASIVAVSGRMEGEKGGEIKKAAFATFPDIIQ